VSLREAAAADTKAILEDQNDFGVPITVTDPAGNSATVNGKDADISQLIDPDTGQAVSGRQVSVVLVISTLEANGLGIPENVPEASKKPWLIEFNDVNGKPHVFKVKSSDPDRTVGIVVCVLEFYEKVVVP